MKYLLLAAAVLGAPVMSAVAADMPVAPPAGRLQAVNNWTGFYIGLNAGGGWSRSHVSSVTSFDPGGYFNAVNVPGVNAAGTGTAQSKIFSGGVQGGYNWQAGNLVFGLEADAGAFGTRASRSTSAPYANTPAFTFVQQQTVRTDWLATVRPRLGFQTGGSLIYITGGIAVTGLTYDARFTDNFVGALPSGAFASSSVSRVKAGWTIGGGFEYSLTGRWTLRAEYLYLKFGGISSNSLLALNPAFFVQPSPNRFTNSADLQSNLVRISLNYMLR